MSAEKGVGADGGHIGPVALSPAVGRRGGIDKVEAAAAHSHTLQDQFGRHHALGVGLPIDAAVAGGTELIGGKDHIIDRVGEKRALHPIHDDGAHSQLAIRCIDNGLRALLPESTT